MSALLTTDSRTRRTPAVFNVALDRAAQRSAALHRVGSMFMAGFFILAVVEVAAIVGGLLLASDVWFESTGVTLFGVVGAVAVTLVLISAFFLVRSGQVADAAEAALQADLADDIWCAYGLFVPAARIPLAVGEESICLLDRTEGPAPVRLVFEAVDQPITVTSVSDLEPLVLGAVG
jgi:hypothetical protein